MATLCRALLFACSVGGIQTLAVHATAGDALPNLVAPDQVILAEYVDPEALRNRRDYITAKLQIAEARDNLNSIRSEMCSALSVVDRVEAELGRVPDDAFEKYCK